MEGNAAIVHGDGNIRRLDFLRAQHHVHVREEELQLSRIVHALGPVVLLVGQARAIEYTSVQDDREPHVPSVAHLGTHVAHVAHLLGYERAVGEVLLMRRAVSIDGERHTLLTDGKLERLPRRESRVSIEHLDFTLVAEVDFRLIAHGWSHLASHVDSGGTHLESSLPFLGLVLILRADGSTNFRSLVEVLALASLGKGSRRHHREQHHSHSFLSHILYYYMIIHL